VDVDAERLNALSYRYDILTVVGDGTSRAVLEQAGVRDSDLIIASTDRDAVNVVVALQARALSRGTLVARTQSVEYLGAWRAGQFDVDHMVSSEVETAHAIARTIGVPAARLTDVFADGQVQLVEFDLEAGCDSGVLDVPLREARVPEDSKIASIIRGDTMILPGGSDELRIGDRIVVIGSPQAAQEWGALIAPGAGKVKDVVVFGAGRAGTAIARQLLEQDIGVRLIETSRERARNVADELPGARVYHSTGMDPDFLDRERIGDAQVAIFAMRDDMKNHYAATLAKVHGIRFTVAVVHEAAAMEVLDRAGVDVMINPRAITAEEIVRFAHDPRTQQVAMLEGDRYEVLDIATRAGSEFAGKKFKEMPIRGGLIGAIVRDGTAIFPHGEDVLRAGDRAIIFTESSRVKDVERAL